MKKLLVVFGLIFICIGVILTFYYNIRELQIGSEPVAAKDTDWNVSGTLEKGDNIIINIITPTEWAYGRFDDVYLKGDPNPIPILHATVTISPSQGNATFFKVDYRPAEMSSGANMLTLWNISLLQEIDPSNHTIVSVPDIENDCLNTTALYNPERTPGFLAVGGTVEYSGTYTVNVGHLHYPRDTPPARLEIFKGTLQTIYPYTFLLPTGAAIVVAGAAITYLGLRARRKKSLSKTRINQKRTPR